MKAEYSAAARDELFETIEYYETQTEDLGLRFLEHVESAIARAVASPFIGAALSVPGTEVVRLIRPAVFPYKLPYVVRDEILLILAVAHQRRKPRYWLDRIGPGG